MLNDKTLRQAILEAQLIGAGKPVRLYDGKGLYLQVSPVEAVARWNFKYRHGGQYRRVSIGIWPTTTATQARAAAARMRADIAEGKPPHVAACAADGTTFTDVANEWQTTNEPRWAARHAVGVERYLARARDAFGKKALGAITPPDVLALVRTVEREGKHETASRVRLYVEKVFEYAQAVGKHTGINPAVPIGSRGVMAPKPRVIHHAAMPLEQVATWLAVLEKAPFAFEVKAALRFTVLTALRTNETIGLRWGDVAPDNSKLTIPAERMKGGRPHTVLLSKPARLLLDALELVNGRDDAEARVFPGRSGEEMSNASMLMALKRTLPEGVEATVHGFRATFSTWANTSGAREAVVERCLAHANGDKVAAAYNRATFEADAAKLWNRWAQAVAP